MLCRVRCKSYWDRFAVSAVQAPPPVVGLYKVSGNQSQTNTVRVTAIVKCATARRWLQLGFDFDWQSYDRSTTCATTYGAIEIRLLFFLLISTKPRAWKLSKMLNNSCNDFLFGVHYVEEGDRIPRCRAMDRRWNRKTVSLLSWVMSVVRLPISWTSSIAMPSHVSAVSMAME